MIGLFQKRCKIPKERSLKLKQLKHVRSWKSHLIATLCLGNTADDAINIATVANRWRHCCDQFDQLCF